MKKILFFFSLFLASTGFANELAKFGTQMSYFYQKPSAASFLQFQKHADKHAPAFKKAKNGADLLISLMIARISEKNGWPIESKVFGEKAKEVLKGESKLAKYINDDGKVDPGKLDMWWAQFFATGDEIYLEKIFMFAGQDPKEFEARMSLVIGAASWSFKANCKQHKAVKAFALKKKSGGGYSTFKMNYLNSI
ncbi:MAG: hypothetical protein MK132_08365 [Lentisphaerales bacterium]|nr:hypothetical protein [Lentisphaerales bacterium]